MKLKGLYFLLMFNFLGFSQKEANMWCFGINGGFNFNNGGPTTFLSSINTSEGSSSISDENGNLLFYTDGVMVWNRNHAPMLNGTGLLGFSSSTQSALIIRKPGSKSIYYIFTADGTSSALGHHMENGYRYSEVDMNLDAGLGGVTSIKNVLLYAPSTEKLCAVKHADGISVWVMTHEWDNSRFVAYKVTCSGVDMNPIISNVGISHAFYPPNYYNGAIGQMKFSPNGKKLAVAVQSEYRVQIFDFDNGTGALTNPVNILAYWPDAFQQPNGDAYDFENVYGVEFSPSSNILFVSCIGSDKLFHYNLSAGTSSAVSSTGIKYGMGAWCNTLPGGGGYSCPAIHGGLQLGPDDKIYLAYKTYSAMNVVANPNVYGFSSSYVGSPALVGQSNYGLPSFIATYFNRDRMKIISNVCDSVMVSTDLDNLSSYSWDFGDPSSSADHFTNNSPLYHYQQSGTYTIELIINGTTCADTLKSTVTVNVCEPPIPPITYTIPNIFTPNGDSANELWGIKFDNIHYIKNYSLRVYNLWGVLMFEGIAPNVKWDGYNTSGIQCSDGVYFFTADFMVGEQKKKLNGNITLMR